MVREITEKRIEAAHAGPVLNQRIFLINHMPRVKLKRQVIRFRVKSISKKSVIRITENKIKKRMRMLPRDLLKNHWRTGYAA